MQQLKDLMQSRIQLQTECSDLRHALTESQSKANETSYALIRAKEDWVTEVDILRTQLGALAFFALLSCCFVACAVLFCLFVWLLRLM